MSARILKRMKLTEGEQSVLLAISVVAIFGACLSFVVVNRLGGSAEIIRPLTNYDIWSIFSGGCGAAAGFHLSRQWFGFPGFRGVGLACLGVFAVSFTGSIIGGTLALPFFGTMFGPFSLGVTLASAPILALLWVTTLLAAHLLVAIWRRERETIFDLEDACQAA